MATHSSTLAWKISWMEEPGSLHSTGSLRVGHDWVTSLSLFTFILLRRKWQPTLVFLPGESHGPWSLVGYSPQVAKSRTRLSDFTHFASSGQSYWSFSFSISPSNEYSGLISFKMDWLDLLAVQGTIKSLLQHHSSKASIFWCSAFFMVQLSHPYVTTGKTIALTRWNFIGKVMTLLFNMLSKLVITFLPRNKHLSFHSCSQHLQWFWSPRNKVSHCFHCFSIYLPWMDGTGFNSSSIVTLKPFSFYSVSYER